MGNKKLPKNPKLAQESKTGWIKNRCPGIKNCHILLNQKPSHGESKTVENLSQYVSAQRTSAPWPSTQRSHPALTAQPSQPANPSAHVILFPMPWLLLRCHGSPHDGFFVTLFHSFSFRIPPFPTTLFDATPLARTFGFFPVSHSVPFPMPP